MLENWTTMDTTLDFRIGVRTIVSKTLRLHVRYVGLEEIDLQRSNVLPLSFDHSMGNSGYLLRGCPIGEGEKVFIRSKEGLRYISRRYKRYFVDLRQSLEDYSRKFSPKSMSTLKRKLKRFSAVGGDGPFWQCYKTPEELEEFYGYARTVSATTYQERLLNAGLPTSQEFKEAMRELGASNRVRAYILFHQKTPIAYLYLPGQHRTLLYQFLGYNPTYTKYSPGTVLQWMALTNLFEERQFQFLDFTEGEGEHKRFFSTGHVLCGDVFYLPWDWHNAALMGSHKVFNRTVEGLSSLANTLRVKAFLKKGLRFGK